MVEIVTTVQTSLFSETNSVALNPQPNYNDCATAAGRRILVANLRIKGYRVVSAAVPLGR
jgi:hypothetical protein